MDELIVFRKTYEYLLWLRPSVLRFAKVYRYSLGIETEQSALRLLRLIILANSETKIDRSRYIKQAIVEYEVQRIYIRIAYEYRCISERQFIHANSLLGEIARLLRGWAKKVQ